MYYNKSEAGHIQRCLFGLSCAAWATIIAPSLWSGPEPVLVMCGTSWIPGSTVDWLASVSLGWLLMAIAMMTPLSLQPLLHIRISSFSDRRWRSTALFLVTYILVWLVAGWGLKLLEIAFSRGGLSDGGKVLVTALAAAVWQCSPLKQRYLNQCHAHRSLSAFGIAADIDALRYGFEHGRSCLGSCWALMLFADSITAWHTGSMICMAILMYCERMDPPATPAWKLRGFRTAYLRIRHAVSVGSRAWSP